MKIPLPDLLRTLREKQFERHLRPAGEVWMLRAWAFAARRPWLYRRGAKVLSWVLRHLGGTQGRMHSLPGGKGWFAYRDLPVPRQTSFKQWYASRGKREV